MDVYKASRMAYITMGLTDVMSGCVMTSHRTLIKGQLYDSTIIPSQIVINSHDYWQHLLQPAYNSLMTRRIRVHVKAKRLTAIMWWLILAISCHRWFVLQMLHYLSIFTWAAGSLLTNYWPHPWFAQILSSVILNISGKGQSNTCSCKSTNQI